MKCGVWSMLLIIINAILNNNLHLQLSFHFALLTFMNMILITFCLMEEVDLKYERHTDDKL